MAKFFSYLVLLVLAFVVFTQAQDYDYTGGEPLRQLSNTTAKKKKKADKKSNSTNSTSKSNATTTKKSNAEVDGADNFATFGTGAFLVIAGANLLMAEK